jgi:LytS/YehU family sensor histidine kinase
MALQYQYQRGIAYTASTLGNVYARKKEHALAYDYITKAVDALQQLDDDFVLPQLHLDAANLLVETEDYDTAAKHLDEALVIAKVHSLPYIELESCRVYARLYQYLKNYEQAFYYLDRASKLREEIFNEEKTKSIAELQTRYEVEQMKASLAEYNLRLLRAQMNPHFIFNSINSINNFILRKDTLQASNYLLQFAQLMRMILDNSAAQYISLVHELEFIKNYLQLESVRFDIPFKWNIDIDDDVDEYSISLPPMILQPYLENAIWHGIAHKETQGHIHVSIADTGEYLNCVIEDDGVGRKRAAELEGNKSHVSKGQSLTDERIRKLNADINGPPAVIVEDRIGDDGRCTGTRVTLNIRIGGLKA